MSRIGIFFLVVMATGVAVSTADTLTLEQDWNYWCRYRLPLLSNIANSAACQAGTCKVTCTIPAGSNARFGNIWATGGSNCYSTTLSSANDGKTFTVQLAKDFPTPVTQCNQGTLLVESGPVNPNWNTPGCAKFPELWATCTVL